MARLTMCIRIIQHCKYIEINKKGLNSIFSLLSNYGDHLATMYFASRFLGQRL